MRGKKRARGKHGQQGYPERPFFAEGAYGYVHS